MYFIFQLFCQYLFLISFYLKKNKELYDLIKLGIKYINHFIRFSWKHVIKIFDFILLLIRWNLYCIHIFLSLIICYHLIFLPYLSLNFVYFRFLLKYGIYNNNPIVFCQIFCLFSFGSIIYNFFIPLRY